MIEVISPVHTKERRALGIKPGDTVRVFQRIEEKDKARLQAFEGLVLSVKHGSEAGATFTVRRVSSGVGVEKTFPLHSPMIEKIEVVKRAKVRRAKLYYIREKVAREIRRQMRGAAVLGVSTEGDAEGNKPIRQENGAVEKPEASTQTETVETQAAETPQTEDKR
jgi:large subunit ribosomal protein L19